MEALKAKNSLSQIELLYYSFILKYDINENNVSEFRSVISIISAYFI
jgi:hypothetical protein